MNKTVIVPAVPEHAGFLAKVITLEWKCPVCGKPRGEPFESISWDGSKRLTVLAWNNPCGHVDKYQSCIVEAEQNGLNPKPNELNSVLPYYLRDEGK